jgi:hypothetical protein
MWRKPLSLVAGVQQQSFEFTSDEWIGDLYVYMGSPAFPVNVTITANNCDVGGIYIPADFSGGSTFQLIAINSGRFIGAGGNGGDGGDDLGASAENGGNGTAGGHAVSSEGFVVDIDVDDGYLLGGGGGGGGASGRDLGASADAGGGGGGGIGFVGQGGLGGTGGSGSVPAAQNGTNGSQVNHGSGGAGGGTSIGTAVGGDGGDWGEGGRIGYDDVGSLFVGRAGIGGNGGNAFAPISGAAAVNFNGSLTEAQLRSQTRVMGETEGFVTAHIYTAAFGSSMMTFTLGWEWNGPSVPGSLERLNSLSGSITLNNYWWRDALDTSNRNNVTQANYEIRQIPATRIGTWDADFGGTEGNWFALSSVAGLSITDSAFRDVRQAIEIRRTVASGGSGESIAQGHYAVSMEDGS